MVWSLDPQMKTQIYVHKNTNLKKYVFLLLDKAGRSVYLSQVFTSAKSGEASSVTFITW